MGVYGLIIIGLIIFIPILYLLYLKFFSPPSPTTTSTTLKDREGYVIKEIRPENIRGKVKINRSNREWSATADEKIENGTKVKVNEVDGVHLIVEEVEKVEEELEDERFLSSFRGVADPIQNSLSSAFSFLKTDSQKEPIATKDGTLSEAEEVPEAEELAESLEEVIDSEDQEEELVTETAEEIPEKKTAEQEESEIVGEVSESETTEQEVMGDEEEVPETAEEIPEKEKAEQEDVGEMERQGVCPSCETLIPSDSEECPECGAKVKSVEREELENEIFEVVEEK